MLGTFVVRQNTERDVPRFSYTLAAPSIYETALKSVQNIKRTGSTSAIVAHHLLVADKIAQTLAALGNGDEKRIIILSPNHFSLGASTIQTTYGDWITPYGIVPTDDAFIRQLIEEVPFVSLEPNTFVSEHGVSSIMPLVKPLFPDAKIVPIVIHEKATQDEIFDLVNVLNELDSDAIVLASIDMSHNLPQHIQVVHDEITKRTIASGTCNGACRLEVDANTVLQTLFEFNRLREDQRWVMTHHGSSLAMGATNDWRENTSHILGYFEKGRSEQLSFVSIQFAGDIMLDRAVRWQIEAKGDGYPWQEMGRYFLGPDLRVGNLEGTITEQSSIATSDPPFRFTFSPSSVDVMKPFMDVVSLANNHSRDFDFKGEIDTQQQLSDMGIDWFGGYANVDPVYRFEQVSIIGYHQFGTSIDELLSVIRDESENGQFVIIFPHWGQEYISAIQREQQKMAIQMVEAGADLIIGSHPHVVQGVELIENTPVVYSLGNFIFDQFEPGTTVGITATVLLEEGRGMIYLSPVSIIDAQPVPVDDERASAIFQFIKNHSSEDIDLSILNGVLSFTYD